MDNQVEMPKYRSHKEVWALKIEEIHEGGNRGSKAEGSLILFFEDPGYGPIKVSKDYRVKHCPQVGGYYVRYKDGYESWSPAYAFESGYTLVE